MQRLKFSKDEGSAFYKELNERIEEYFSERNLSKTGNGVMYFKIFLYFGLDVLFYWLMMHADTKLEFCVYYVLMGLFVLMTAFNVSHDACHGAAVKSKFWNKVLFSLSFIHRQIRVCRFVAFCGFCGDLEGPKISFIAFVI